MPKMLLLPIFLFLLLQGCSPSVRPSDISTIQELTPPPRLVPTRQYPLILIDPGHGGEDKGAESPFKPGCQEKSLTLATSCLVKDFLQQMGYPIKMTRSEDIFIPLQTRASMANEAKPALFVSIHYNSAPNKGANGIEVFYYLSKIDKKRTNDSKALASIVLAKVLERTGAKSRGVKSENFAVIRETEMPAILIEGGFLTNQEEMQKIKDPLYIRQLALGIALGVDQYVKGLTGSAMLP